MVLPPPMPPTDPTDRADGKNLDADDPAMNAFRAHANFPAADAARDTRLPAAMNAALAQAHAKQVQTDSGRAADAAATGNTPPAAAKPTGFRRYLPYLAAVAALLIVAAWVIPAITAVQGQAQRNTATVGISTGTVYNKRFAPQSGYEGPAPASAEDVPYNQWMTHSMRSPGAPQSGYEGRVPASAGDQPGTTPAPVPSDRTQWTTANPRVQYDPLGAQRVVTTLDGGSRLPPPTTTTTRFADLPQGGGGGGGGEPSVKFDQADMPSIPDPLVPMTRIEDLGVHAAGIDPQTPPTGLPWETGRTAVTETGRDSTIQRANPDGTVQLESLTNALTNTPAQRITEADVYQDTNTDRVIDPDHPAATGAAVAADIFTKRPDPTNPVQKSVVKNERELAPAHVWQRAELVPNAARLKVGDGPNSELKCTALQANVRVEGYRARVLLDLYFFNDRDQQLQGSFDLRLPDGAAPYYLAFGETVFKSPTRPADRSADQPDLFTPKEAMNISFNPQNILRERGTTFVQPKEARMVPREKAAFAYRETVYRRQIDPALLEWTGAGIFSARVFPLMPQKLHRIVVGYDVDLVRTPDGLSYTFSLPKNIPTMAIDLRIERPGNGTPGEPLVAGTVTPAVEPFIAGTTAYYRYDNPQADQLRVELKPAFTASSALLLTGTEGNPADHGDIGPGGPGEQGNNPQYFAAQFVPALPEPAMGPSRPDAVFLIDTSLSMNPTKFNTWRKLVAEMLEKNQANADALPSTTGGTPSGGIARFKVLFFNIRTHAWRADWTDNTAANRTALLTDIDQLVLEGASDIHSALQAAHLAAQAGNMEVQPSTMGPADFKATRVALFLLSDGAATWGDTQLLTADATKLPIYTYLTGSAGNNRGALQALANATHGAVFTVADEQPATLAAAAVAHRFQPWQLQSIAINGGSDLLIAGNPTTLYPGQPLTVVGRGAPAANAQFQLAVQQDTAAAQVFTSLVTARYDSDLAVRAYGQVATDRIEQELTATAGATAAGNSTEKFAQAYACHFRVTGQSCSLLMLETEADYERYNIPADTTFAFDIQSTPVARIVPAAGSAKAADAKTAFLDQLTRLSSMPGMTFTPPAALTTAAQSLPVSAFEVTPETLTPGDLTRLHLPAEYVTALSGGAITREAAAMERLRREQQGDRAGALMAYSSNVEQHPGDGVVLRDAAYACLELHYPAHAYHLLRRAALSRPYEADTYLTLAQCLSDTGKTDLAVLWYEVALAGAWDSRFGAYHRIAALEYAALLDRIAAKELTTALPEFCAARRTALQPELPVTQADLAVILQWNTDGTDVDLHVVEPGGEECSYQHTTTATGASITQDVTRGYGPELYLAPKAAVGQYEVSAHYYANDRTQEAVATSAYLTLIRGYGSARPQIEHRVVRLATAKENHVLATLSFK